MRTYLLQDDGLDTFDANTTLAFDNDERNYGIAARMFRILNCTRTVLLATIGPSSTVSQRPALKLPSGCRSRRRLMPTTASMI